MSYDDSYGRGGGGGSYGGDERRGEGSGGARDEYYGGGSQGGDAYGGGASAGGDSYGGERRQQGGGEYGERQGGGYGGGGDSYGDRPSGGYGGSGGSYGDEPRRQEGHHGDYGGASDNFSGAAQHASSHAGDSGDSSLFSTALGMLSGKKSKLQDEGVDEDDAVTQHRKLYGGGDSGGHEQATSGNVGAAAAMQAMKMFTGGKAEDAKGGQSKFIGLAMAQAAKLFDQQSSQGKTVSCLFLSGWMDGCKRVRVKADK
ncbi:hypothetical protein BU26DRAFT_515657 [Trematosphaeria pertusa]|uniref:DUF7721 domain-containing protein n=1 Tax=Trematosphaeria pertusa TaxID=390896 RepID=A0A6A6IRY4_9PLEO|nr:uncharacterized protein BU26DRAFT_515657 [Trematosphaeria pertusa]KAF2253295.1 hypothetical protein BU26DRAFT_515657 [Trematosphaeria pertusa]